MRPEWTDFTGGKWDQEVNVRDFIQRNYTPYDGDDSFLAGPTQNTLDLWNQVLDLQRQEREAGGVLDMDTKVVSTITSTAPDTWTSRRKRSSAFRPTSRLSVPCSLTAESAWRRKRARTTVTRWIRRFPNFSPFTAKHTTRAASMLTIRR